MNRPLQRLWVIAYDIQDDAIRASVHDRLKDHGQRVQYSVFECWLGSKDVEQLRAELQTQIEPGDRIRWYPLCQWCSADVQWQGKGERAENAGFYTP